MPFSFSILKIGNPSLPCKHPLWNRCGIAGFPTTIMHFPAYIRHFPFYIIPQFSNFTANFFFYNFPFYKLPITCFLFYRLTHFPILQLNFKLFPFSSFKKGPFPFYVLYIAPPPSIDQGHTSLKVYPWCVFIKMLPE